MADPTPYAPGYDFTSVEKGPQFNAELADVALATEELVDAVMDIRRSDGALKNGIVTIDSLAPGVLANAASEAAASATEAAASAQQAALYEGFLKDNVVALLADSVLTYTAGQPSTVAAGDYVLTRSEGFSYLVAASGATNHHVSTAGGVKLYVQPGADGYNVRAFGAVGDGTTSDTAAIQKAIEAAQAVGGSVVVPDGNYRLTASTLSETYDNNGSSIVATSACIILRPLVKLVGYGEVWFKPSSPALHAILPISPNGSEIRAINIDGGWAGTGGAGHGILQLQTIGSEYCRNFTVADLTVKNVASYGIGIENGEIENLLIENVKTYNTGADGIDLKRRLPAATKMKLHNITVDTFGQRTNLAGQAGIDIRGEVIATNIHVYNVGANGITGQDGIRMRTLPAPATGEGPSATGSSLVGFYVTGVGNECTAVLSGSPYTRIVAGYCENTGDGVVLTGNVNGSAMQSQVVGVTAKGMTRGFAVFVNVTGCVFSGCISDTCTTGFRNEATDTTLAGCSDMGSTTPYSESSGAAPSSNILTSRFYDKSFSSLGNAAGRVRLLAKGTDTDLDIAFEPKGAGYLRFGTHTSNADTAVTGYISIRDSSGTLRRLAVIS